MGSSGGHRNTRRTRRRETGSRHLPARFVRRRLAVAGLAVLVAVPVALQVELVRARQGLDAARSRTIAAQVAERDASDRLDAAGVALGASEAEAEAAAASAGEARERLAATGVDEHALLTVLAEADETRLGVERQSSRLAAARRHQQAQRPQAEACVLDAARALTHAARASIDGRGSSAELSAACRAAIVNASVPTGPA